MSERWLTGWALAAIAFGGASLIVPLYVVELGGDAFVLGVLFATASFVGVPGALVFGNLADRTGKRRDFVLMALGITVATMAAIPLLDQIVLVIVANALLWLGFAAAIPVLTLLVVAGEPADRWTDLIARLNKFQGVGWALGLAIGFLIVTGGALFFETITAQRLFFGVCALSAGLGFVIGVRELPPDPEPGEEPTRRRLQTFVRRAGRFNVRGAAFPFTPGGFDPRSLHPRRFVDRFTPKLAVYFSAVLLFFTGFGTFFAPLPAYLTDIGYGSSEIFALYLALNVAAALFYGRAAALAGTYDLTQVHLGGLVTRGVALPSVIVIGALFGASLFGFGMVALVFVVIGLTWAVIVVTAATLVTQLAPAIIRGEALGLYGALGAVGGGIGGLLGGRLAITSYPLAFLVAGGLVVSGATIVYVLGQRAEPTTAPVADPT